MSRVSISVILPTYNGEEYICNAIDSVLSQIYNEFELIIVDDNSDDSTWELTKKYNDDRIRRFRNQENRGVAKTTNRAVKKANGEILAFIDQDDVWKPTKLARHQIEHLRSKASVVYSDHSTIDENGNVIREVEHPDPKPSGKPLISQLCRSGNFLKTMSCITVTNAAWEAEGGFDTNLEVSADIDLWLRLANDYIFKHINEILILKRSHESNLSDNYFQAHKDNEYIIEKARNKYPFIEGGVEEDMKLRLDTRWAKGAFHTQNQPEVLKYGIPVLRRRFDLHLMAIVLLSIIDIFTGRVNLGHIIYKMYKCVSDN